MENTALKTQSITSSSATARDLTTSLAVESTTPSLPPESDYSGSGLFESGSGQQQQRLTPSLVQPRQSIQRGFEVKGQRHWNRDEIGGGNQMVVKVTPMEILLPVFLFFLLSFFVALVAAIYRLVYTMIIKFRLTQRFRRSARNNFRHNNDTGNVSNSPYMEEPPSYISLYPNGPSVGHFAQDRPPEDIEMRPSCCSPVNSDAVFINLGAHQTPARSAHESPPAEITAVTTTTTTTDPNKVLQGKEARDGIKRNNTL